MRRLGMVFKEKTHEIRRVSMQLNIKYDDDTIETLPAAVQADIVSTWMSFHPGIVILAEPKYCFLGSDFFSAAMNEANLRFGQEVPLDELDSPPMQGFSWEVIGSEAAECRAMIDRWAKLLTSLFDPHARAEQYLYQGVLQILSDEDARLYENDRKCWMFYLDDPRAEAALCLRAIKFTPIWIAGKMS
jgi:hypothetical protein